MEYFVKQTWNALDRRKNVIPGPHCGLVYQAVMSPLYPALFSNPLCCSCPVHFAEARRGKTGCCQGQKVSPGGWSISQPPGIFSALLLKFQGAKPFLATTARKLPDTAFQFLEGIRMPSGSQDGHKPSYNAKQRASLFWAADQIGIGNYWQGKLCRESQRQFLQLSELFGSVARQAETSL